MRVTVVGLGYVGLVTATCLARLGQHVVGLETDAAKMSMLRSGAVPYYEPHLDSEVAAQRASDRLSFTDDAAQAVNGADVIMVCVGTPSEASGRANLQYVLQVADTLGEYLTGRPVVALRSTVPVGTTVRVEATLNAVLRRRGYPGTVPVLANPEFLRTGRAIEDFLRPTRVVVGRTELAITADIDVLTALYAPLEAPILVMDASSAELVKNAANAFLAMKVSFANELAGLCEAAGASVDEVVQGMAYDPRIGGEFLRPGIGYGGSCLPKDVRSVISMGSDHGQQMPLLHAVDQVNQDQPAHVADRLAAALDGSLHGKRVAVLGLAFKPDTDDIRDSPALAFARVLRERGANVVGCDPQASARVAAQEPWLELAPDPLSAASGADAVVLATEWPAYVTVEPNALSNVMPGRVFVDARNAMDAERLRTAGFTYVGVGRRSRQHTALFARVVAERP